MGDALRKRVLLVFLLIAVVMLFLSLMLAYFSQREQLVNFKAVAFVVILIFGALIAIRAPKIRMTTNATALKFTSCSRCEKYASMSERNSITTAISRNTSRTRLRSASPMVFRAMTRVFTRALLSAR